MSSCSFQVWIKSKFMNQCTFLPSTESTAYHKNKTKQQQLCVYSQNKHLCHYNLHFVKILNPMPPYLWVLHPCISPSINKNYLRKYFISTEHVQWSFFLSLFPKLYSITTISMTFPLYYNSSRDVQRMNNFLQEGRLHWFY